MKKFDVLRVLMTLLAFAGLYLGSKHSLVILCIALGFGATFLAVGILKSAEEKRKNDEKNDSQKPIFTGKTVTLVLHDGIQITGKIDREPEDCIAFVMLSDAQIEDNSAVVPSDQVYDNVAIPLENVQSFLLRNLDRV